MADLNGDFCGKKAATQTPTLSAGTAAAELHVHVAWALTLQATDTVRVLSRMAESETGNNNVAAVNTASATKEVDPMNPKAINLRHCEHTVHRHLLPFEVRSQIQQSGGSVCRLFLRT